VTSFQARVDLVKVMKCETNLRRGLENVLNVSPSIKCKMMIITRAVNLNWRDPCPQVFSRSALFHCIFESGMGQGCIYFMWLTRPLYRLIKMKAQLGGHICMFHISISSTKILHELWWYSTIEFTREVVGFFLDFFISTLLVDKINLIIHRREHL
jgi:hypothetical protein